MKTLKALFATAIIASVSFLGSAQADQLMDTIHPESADLFDHSNGVNSSSQTGIVSLSDDSNKKVWSYEYEQYVSPDEFSGNDYADINALIEENPTAAGSRNEDVFKYNETAGEYQLN